jgi:hypothetical protein
VDFDVTDQLLIRYSASVRYWKNWHYNRTTVHQLFIDIKKVYDSHRREVLYNVSEFGMPMKLLKFAVAITGVACPDTSLEAKCRLYLT